MWVLGAVRTGHASSVEVANRVWADSKRWHAISPLSTLLITPKPRIHRDITKGQSSIICERVLRLHRPTFQLRRLHSIFSGFVALQSRR